MSTDVHHFKVRAFECIAVSDGTLTYAPPTFPPPATLLFGNAPRERLEQTLRQHNIQPEHWAEWISPYICLLVNTGEHRVLENNRGRWFQNAFEKIVCFPLFQYC